MRLRSLTDSEARLAAEVFGGALDPRWIRLLTGVPTGGWAISLFGLILFPSDVSDFAAEPPNIQAWFVHELVHAWQAHRRPLWMAQSWVRVALSGGYVTRAAYRYALPVVWNALNLEQQAKVIEHRFLLRRGVRTTDMPESAGLADYTNLPAPG